MGQQTGVILPPTATNPRLESLQEDGKSPAIVVLCVIRRLALLWVEVLASRAPAHASKPPARAAISGIVTAVPGPLRQRQPTSATKSAQSRRVPSRPSWISIGLAAIGAAIGSATIWAASTAEDPQEADLSRRSKARPQNCLLDHLVGEGEQRLRHVEAKRVGSSEVDYKPILGWVRRFSRVAC